MSDDQSTTPTTPVDPSTFLSDELRELWRRFADGVEALGATRPDVSIHTKRALTRGQKSYVEANGEDTVMYPDFMGDDDGVLLFGKPCDEGVYQNLPTLQED